MIEEDNIFLKVNGKQYTGWETASIKRSMNAFTSCFDLMVSQPVENTLNDNFDIKCGMSCEIFVGNTKVITGWIEDLKPSYDSAKHSIGISGRSKTCDLVDCSVIFKTGQIMASDFKTIVNTILKPFKIGLTINTKINPINIDFQIQQGETASSAIERLCFLNKFVFFDDSNGNLVIEEIEEKFTSFTLINKKTNGNKNNVLSASGGISIKDRFNKYIIKSQMVGSDFVGGDNISTEGIAIDKAVERYRPIIIIADSSNNQTSEERALWEKSLRIGKGISFNYNINGWRNSNKKLWSPNSFINIDDDLMKLHDKCIISEVILSVSAEAGKIASLQITSPNAFISNKNFKAGQEWFPNGV